MVGIFKYATGVPALNCPEALATGTVRISPPAPGVISANTSRVPLGLKELGSCLLLLRVNGCGLPAPSARVQNIPPADWKTTARPSGLHTGNAVSRPLVKRALLPRCQS